MSEPLFQIAMGWLVSAEGGYYDDPGAGPTYRGIVQTYFDKWLVDQGSPPMGVQQLANHEELIEAYYLAQYWLPARIYGLLPSQAPALVVFDGVVQHGVKTMIKLMQGVIGAPVDGDFGPLTLAQYNQAITRSGAQTVATNLIARRKQFYIALNRPQDEAGWMNRMENLTTLCQTLAA